MNNTPRVYLLALFALSSCACSHNGAGGSSTLPQAVAEPARSERNSPPPQASAGPHPNTIKGVVGAQEDELRQCYLAGTFKNSQLAGTVNVSFTIETNGRVSTTSDAGSNLKDDEVVACVLSVFANLRFPPGGSAATEVTYPVSFGYHG